MTRLAWIGIAWIGIGWAGLTMSAALAFACTGPRWHRDRSIPDNVYSFRPHPPGVAFFDQDAPEAG